MPSLINGNKTKSLSMMGDETTIWEAVCPSGLRLVLECVPGEDVMYVVDGQGPTFDEPGKELEGSRGFGRDLCESITERMGEIAYDRPDHHMTVFSNHPQFSQKLGVTEPVVIMNNLPKDWTIERVAEVMDEIWEELDELDLVPPYGEPQSAMISVDARLLDEVLLVYAGEVSRCGLCPAIRKCNLPDKMVSRVGTRACAEMLMKALTGSKDIS